MSSTNPARFKCLRFINPASVCIFPLTEDIQAKLRKQALAKYAAFKMLNRLNLGCRDTQNYLDLGRGEIHAFFFILIFFEEKVNLYSVLCFTIQPKKSVS